VNYYKRHIGDYAAATRHLSLLEHGVYCMLLDVYYTTERPLPADSRAVYRLVGARSDEERSTVDTILAEFFTTEPDGHHQPRCDEEIALKQEKSVKNAEIGKKGGRPKEITDSVIPENPQASATLLDENETVSTNSPPRNPSHKPIASNHDSGTPDGVPVGGKSAAIPDCPHLLLIDLYGKHLAQLPQPKPELWNGKNAESMRARWRWVLTAKTRGGKRYAQTGEQALDWFDRFFGYVAKSDFLSGRSGKWTGCDLGWLMKADNFAKVVQGNYENKEQPA
jgi:uncharacterized protein YdaU (DUF1376 family)